MFQCGGNQIFKRATIIKENNMLPIWSVYFPMKVANLKVRTNNDFKDIKLRKFDGFYVISFFNQINKLVDKNSQTTKTCKVLSMQCYLNEFRTVSARL